MCPGAALNRYLFLYLSFDFYMFNEIELTTDIDRKYTEWELIKGANRTEPKDECTLHSQTHTHTQTDFTLIKLLWAPLWTLETQTKHFNLSETRYLWKAKPYLCTTKFILLVFRFWFYFQRFFLTCICPLRSLCPATIPVHTHNSVRLFFSSNFLVSSMNRSDLF